MGQKWAPFLMGGHTVEEPGMYRKSCLCIHSIPHWPHLSEHPILVLCLLQSKACFPHSPSSQLRYSQQRLPRGGLKNNAELIGFPGISTVVWVRGWGVTMKQVFAEAASLRLHSDGQGQLYSPISQTT